MINTTPLCRKQILGIILLCSALTGGAPAALPDNQTSTPSALAAPQASDAAAQLQAPKALQEKANRGEAEAQFQLGMFYEKLPFSQAANQQFSRQWYRKAALQRHPEAAYKMGEMNEWPCQTGTDLASRADAARWYKIAAEHEHKEAQYKLAKLRLANYNGNDPLYNPKDGIKWMSRAAAQGNSLAMIELGNLHAAQYSFPVKDHATYFDESIENGMREATSCYERGLKLADKDIARTGDPGQCIRLASSSAAMNLAGMYEKGRPGLPKDIEKAKAWYLIAETRGDRWGDLSYNPSFKLGELFTASGNYKESCKWYKKAADANSPVIRFGCLMVGHGIEGGLNSAFSVDEYASAEDHERKNEFKEAADLYKKSAESRIRANYAGGGFS